jgi:N-acetylmuramoyl-L-alanine amidase
MRHSRVLVLTLLLLWTRPSLGEPLRVLLDPGHGGTDHGAVRGPVREADICLKISTELAELLKHDPRFTVSLSRTGNQNLSLLQRAEVTRNSNAEVFVSIHANASNDLRAQGMEIYFQNQMASDEESMFLASRENQSAAMGEIPIEENPDEKLTAKGDVHRILDDLQRNHRISLSRALSKILLKNMPIDMVGRHNGQPIRQAPFYVISQLHVPAVLVEVGFVTHPEEGPKLNTPVYQKELAQNLYRGLVKFKELMDKERSTSLQ